jgi:ABC-type multidrug transport system fused ATPase/permease subunit
MPSSIGPSSIGHATINPSFAAWLPPPISTANFNHGMPMPKSLARYIWQLSGLDQIWLALITIAVVLLSMAPLELQRRTINDAIKQHALRPLLLLCAGYLVIVLVQGLLKLWLNIYRSKVGEVSTRQLRVDTRRAITEEEQSPGSDPAKEGVKVSIAVSEVDPVGSFVGMSLSEPLLHGGLLIAVFGYMFVVQPVMALVCLGVLAPQLVFVPLMQGTINRRTKSRIKILREVSADIVNDAVDNDITVPKHVYAQKADRIFELDMHIYRLKFSMNFLMNLLYHIAIVGVLGVGGWFVIEGKTEVGTIVAFISGLDKINDPWGDLVNYFRDATSARIKYKLIAKVLNEAPRAGEPEDRPAGSEVAPGGERLAG